MTEYEPREFTITGTVSAPESVGARELAESLKRGLEQSARGATVDLGDFTKYATDDAEDEGGCPCDRCGKHHPAATCAEPEDKDDLYVEPEPLKEGVAVRALAQAIIWTREYVGEATLPAMKGWSWYDALREYAPEFLPEEPTQCTSLYEYEEGKYVRCCRASGHANSDHQGYGKGWLAESARLADGGAS